MNLNGKWKLYYYEYGKESIMSPDKLVNANIPSIVANVPGNVELDLSAARILPEDLFYGENILEAENFEKYEWWYEKDFILENPSTQEKVTLCFNGVDCYAEYFLNGKKIGDSQNMFIENKFDVTDSLLYNQKNTIHVHIFSAVVMASEYAIEPYLLANSWFRKNFSAFCRKAPHSFGWDIMPRALSAGIWRDVSLSYDKPYGFSYLYFFVTGFSGNDTYVTMLFDSSVPKENTFEGMDIEVSGVCGDHTFIYKKRTECKCGKLEFSVKDIKLWWPKNYGDPNLYTITVKAFSKSGEFLFDTTVKRGFRTIKLDRTDTIQDGMGKFQFVVNDKPIRVLGSNWVPMDVYHSRDKARLQKALELAVDVGCNILRCWGGNVYEDTEFFDFCDSNGILVWQDFAMACQYYPQDYEFCTLLKNEAEAVVKKLCQHPSLALWCGDNEIDYMVAGYGKFPSNNKLTREVLPDVIRRLDPSTPYIASSPYISDRAFELGESCYPENHLWGARIYFKDDYYAKSPALFVSEIGYHGCPSEKSIRKFIEPEYVWPYKNNKQWNLHSTDQNNSDARVMLMDTQIRSLFGTVPTDMETFIEASQCSQAEAYKFFIERVRANMENMGGVIWWNLIDGWPQMSDAVVDYYYCKKKAYEFIKRSSQPFIILCGEEKDGQHDLVCANSSFKEFSGEVTVIDAKTKAIVYSGDFCSKPNQNTHLAKLSPEGQGMYIIKWTANGEMGSNTYLYGKAPFSFTEYKNWLNFFEGETV